MHNTIILDTSAVFRTLRTEINALGLAGFALGSARFGLGSRRFGLGSAGFGRAPRRGGYRA